MLLLAHNYDEALKLYDEYKDYMLCVISDIRYKIGSDVDPKAGFRLLKHIRQDNHELPVILQSSEDENELPPWMRGLFPKQEFQALVF